VLALHVVAITWSDICEWLDRWAPLADWLVGKVSGELRYSDLDGDEWITRLRMKMSEGESGQL
jgi:hypothetical protein